MVRWAARWLTVLASGAALAACATGTQPASTVPVPAGGGMVAAGAAGAAGAAAASDAAVAPKAVPAATPGPVPATVTLALTGDSNTAWTAERSLRVGVGPTTPFLRTADVAVVNLETVVVADRRGLVAERKNFTFLTGPAFLDRLKDAGVDVVTAANNHSMDYKVEGMRRMLALKSPVPIIGIGATADQAFAPWRTTVRGRPVLVFGANDVETDGLHWSALPGRPGQAVVTSPAGLARLVGAVRAARAATPTAVLVVDLHWGLEPQTCQNRRQVSIAQALADAGADVVVGSHSHRLQPAATLRGRTGRSTLVAYGLGNFVFNAASPAAAETGVLSVTVPGRGAPSFVFHPARIERGIPQPLTGAAAVRAQRAYATHLQRCP